MRTSRRVRSSFRDDDDDPNWVPPTVNLGAVPRSPMASMAQPDVGWSPPTYSPRITRYLPHQLNQILFVGVSWPLYRAQIVLQTQHLNQSAPHFSNTFDVIKRLPTIEGGLSALFRGTWLIPVNLVLNYLKHYPFHNSIIRFLFFTLGVRLDDSIASSVLKFALPLIPFTTMLTLSILGYPALVIAARDMTDIGTTQRRRFRGVGDIIKRTYQREGLRGFFRGFPAFVAHNIAPFLILPFLGGIIAVLPFSIPDNVMYEIAMYLIGPFFAYPFLTVSTRQAVQHVYSHHSASSSALKPKYSNMFNCIRTIIREEGFKGLYKGFFPYMVITLGLHFLGLDRYQRS